jgi:dTDP-4-amino-4,6-dideoxygalactose transaminase
MIIPHSRPLIDAEDIRAVSDVLASGHISEGEKVREFEAQIASFVGTRYGVALSSGTAAIHTALVGLHVVTGDEVIVPSFVCAGPYMAVLHAGAIPKIVDVDTSDYNLSAATVKSEITTKTKAIIVPHMFGNPAELDELLDLGIPLIEDCAQALGSKYKNRRAGSFGKLSVCSFYATKMITTGEGGLILTDDSEIYHTVLEMREYDKKPLGTTRYNYKMSDIQAALGVSQFRKLGSFIDRRKKIAMIYNERFSRIDVSLPCIASYKDSVFYRYVVKVNRLAHGQRVMKKKGVMCERPIWQPLHKSLCGIKCPSSDYLYHHSLSIPLYPSLSEEEVDRVARTVESAFTTNV